MNRRKFIKGAVTAIVVAPVVGSLAKEATTIIDIEATT